MSTLSAIYFYPVKSCGGIALQHAEIGPLGLALDRHWMVVDAQGSFLTQRSHPAMACIRPVLDGGALVLQAPGMPPLQLDARGEDGAAAARGSRGPATVAWCEGPTIAGAGCRSP